jgi:predicted ABC-type ATPase
MKKVLALCAIALIPTVLMAYPPVGTLAPNVTVYDTSGVAHSLISESHGNVIHVFFCWSG